MAQKYTVSRLLSVQKSLISRRQELQMLRNASTTRHISRNADKSEEIQEPTYDVKALDKRIVELNNALLEMDWKIKEHNASASIDVDFDYKELLADINK